MGWVSRSLPCPSCAHDHGLLPCDLCPCPAAVVLGVYPAPVGHDAGQPAPEPPLPVPNGRRWETASDLHKHHPTPAAPRPAKLAGTDF